MNDLQITNLIKNIIYWATNGYTEHTYVSLHKTKIKTDCLIASPNRNEIEKIIKVFGLPYDLYHGSHCDCHIFIPMGRLFG